MTSSRMSQFYKTKTCPWYFKGKCERGDICRFAHNEVEKRDLPDLSRTSLCPTFMKTNACHNINCKFAHQMDQLRATDDMYKTSLCFMFMRSRCDAGDQCRHAHGPHELRTLTSDSFNEETASQSQLSTWSSKKTKSNSSVTSHTRKKMNGHIKSKYTKYSKDGIQDMNNYDKFENSIKPSTDQNEFKNLTTKKLNKFLEKIEISSTNNQYIPSESQSIQSNTSQNLDVSYIPEYSNFYNLEEFLDNDYPDTFSINKTNNIRSKNSQLPNLNISSSMFDGIWNSQMFYTDYNQACSSEIRDNRVCQTVSEPPPVKIYARNSLPLINSPQHVEFNTATNSPAYEHRCLSDEKKYSQYLNPKLLNNNSFISSRSSSYSEIEKAQISMNAIAMNSNSSIDQYDNSTNIVNEYSNLLNENYASINTLYETLTLDQTSKGSLDDLAVTLINNSNGLELFDSHLDSNKYMAIAEKIEDKKNSAESQMYTAEHINLKNFYLSSNERFGIDSSSTNDASYNNYSTTDDRSIEQQLNESVVRDEQPTLINCNADKNFQSNVFNVKLNEHAYSNIPLDLDVWNTVTGIPNGDHIDIIENKKIDGKNNNDNNNALQSYNNNNLDNNNIQNTFKDSSLHLMNQYLPLSFDVPYTATSTTATTPTGLNYRSDNLINTNFFSHNSRPCESSTNSKDKHDSFGITESSNFQLKIGNKLSNITNIKSDTRSNSNVSQCDGQYCELVTKAILDKEELNLNKENNQLQYNSAPHSITSNNYEISCQIKDCPKNHDKLLESDKNNTSKTINLTTHGNTPKHSKLNLTKCNIAANQNYIPLQCTSPTEFFNIDNCSPVWLVGQAAAAAMASPTEFFISCTNKPNILPFSPEV